MLPRVRHKAAGMSTTEEVYASYLNHLCRYADSTRDRYAKTVRLFLDSMPNLESICSEDIERYILTFYQKPLKASSVNQILIAIRQFFVWLEDYRNWPNPAKRIKTLRQMPPKRRFLTIEEYQKILQLPPSHRKNCLIWLCNSGLRSFEFMNLRSENLNDDFITIIGKGQKLRKVPLNKNLRNILESEPEFFTIHVSKSKKWLGKQTYKVAHQIGIPNFSPHACRRYFATTLYRRGISILIISKLLGHSKLSTTELYLNLLDNDLAGSTDYLES